ncbi:MAG: hypothetical protein LQ342_000907 [Letrouitia transgressa]|nr:MAG: hypothetical protein LQ342_000907 [Letrouitia transgressa]
MASYPLDAFLTVEAKSHIANPPAAVTKDSHVVSDPSASREFEELHGENHYNGPSAQATSNRSQTPATSNDLETSRSSSPVNEEAAEVLQTLSNPPMNKYRLLSACLMCFGNGLNDSAPGALIPYMEKNYAIGYAIVSLIFVTNAIGFISAAPFVHTLQARLGRAKMLVLAESIVICAYVMLVCTPPFPVVVLAFLLIGLGIAFNLALNNVFCANLANSTTTLGCFHGSYGIGGTVGPLIATALVSAGRKWSDFYFIALGVAALNLLFAYWAFRAFEQDNPAQTHILVQTSSGHRLSKSRLLKEALKNKTTVLGSLFIFAYQGAEVSISGWVISFLISYRHSSPARVGYVTAGFWAGITIGRFVLSHPAHKVGEKVAVVGLVIGAMLFQLLVWLVPNVIGEAVAVSIVGLLLGPVYPCATTVFSRLLPRRLQVSSLAAVSALGSSGGAVAPFFTGLLAQQVGTWILHPICVALFVSMLALWLGLPRVGKRRE